MKDISDIIIRTNLTPGDIGYVAYLHGSLYHKENGYSIDFEKYVIAGLSEFFQQYNPANDCVWICEHHHQMVGFLMAVNRIKAVQLRYFLLLPEYRGYGLGKKLMDLFMKYLTEHRCEHAYLWTTNEQQAAIALYERYGFKLTEEKASTTFGKPLVEQRYDLFIANSVENLKKDKQTY